MNNPKCIACGESCSLKESIGEQKWEALKTKSEKWDGLDKYGNLWRSTDWISGPSNKHLHNSCYTSLSSVRSLNQAVNRKEKMQNTVKQSRSYLYEGKQLLVSKVNVRMGSNIWFGIK